jgi:RsiW-degrading membrane proteinase PrsW (M82 family)
VLWLAAAAVRGLPLGSAQRAWGVFASGLVLGPALIIFIELLTLVGFVMVGALWFSTQPELVQGLTELLPRLSGLQNSPDQILELLQPYLVQPPILFGGFAFIAVVVPLIEESLKPIGLWLLARRSLSPAAGFAAGALSGAGFALFESMAMATGGETWIIIVVTRIATAVLHILTAGLTGYALALAWRTGRYAYLGLAFMTSVTIHGMWNGLAMMSAVKSLPGVDGAVPFGLITRLGSVAPMALVILAALFFSGLLGSNRLLRREAG